MRISDWSSDVCSSDLAARRAFPGIALGGGMFSYFTELNRKRPPVGLLDFVSHATCPIVHAADDRSVIQTLEAIPHIEIGRAHVCTPVTNAHLVCRLLLEKKKKQHTTIT